MIEVTGKKVKTLLVKEQGAFPNNERLSVLIYRNVAELHDKEKKAGKQLRKLFKKNNWKNSWRDGIYDYHHYHSITHEVLGVYDGKVTIQLGGPEGESVRLGKGDVIIIPAGVAHRNVKSDEDFKCVGAYPNGSNYDMNYGYEKEERPRADENIARVEMPEFDPVFGEKGPLFDYWK